jgi:hypothetical protein
VPLLLDEIGIVFCTAMDIPALLDQNGIEFYAVYPT